METRILTYLRAVRVATVEEIATAVGSTRKNVLAWLLALDTDGRIILFNDTVNAGQVTGAMVR